MTEFRVDGRARKEKMGGGKVTRVGRFWTGYISSDITNLRFCWAVFLC